MFGFELEEFGEAFFPRGAFSTYGWCGSLGWYGSNVTLWGCGWIIMGW
jgi:hypothetical protein